MTYINEILLLIQLLSSKTIGVTYYAFVLGCSNVMLYAVT